MQAHSQWTQPRGTLGAIVAEARLRADQMTSRSDELAALASTVHPGPSLESALRHANVALLAEVKRRSPSKGAIAHDLDAVAQARAYELGGAAALSILTEPNHFAGAVEDLVAVRERIALPTLKKDFHVSYVQLLEARALGASAALLIARAVHPDVLADLMAGGRDLGLELLVEIRDEAELERALMLGATMIGVNNRDLETLEIDPSTAERLIPLIPPTVVAIAESGVRTRADVERYGESGADAVLVGSVLSSAADPRAATRLLAGVTRRERAL